MATDVGAAIGPPDTLRKRASDVTGPVPLYIAALQCHHSRKGTKPKLHYGFTEDGLVYYRPKSRSELQNH